MILAGTFACVLFVGLIVGDWMYFLQLSSEAGRYGYGISRVTDRVTAATVEHLQQCFDRNGLLSLPHGVARWFPEASRIVLRPQYQLFSMRFRTAWPLKGSIELHSSEDDIHLFFVKRTPWSSAILTFLWFLIVGGGTLSFLVSFVLDGGMATFGGLLLGFGVVGVGLMVMAFGFITVALAYRLENGRLTQVYEELRHAMQGRSSAG